MVCSSLGEFKGDRFNMRSFIEKIISIASIDRKNFWLNQLWCFFCLIVYTVSSVVFPSFLSKIVDVGIATHNNVALVKYSLEMLLCGIIMIAFNYLQKVYFFKFGNRITLDTRRKIYHKLCEVKLSFWSQHKIGDVLTMLDSDIGKFQELLTSNISELIVNTFLAIGIAIYILMLNVKIGVAVIILAIIFAIIQKKISDKSKLQMKALRHSIGDFNSYSTETINNMPALQMTGKIPFVEKLYSEHCDVLAIRGLRFTKTTGMVSIAGMSSNILAIILVLLVGAADVSSGLLSVGVLFSLTIYVQRLYSPIVSLGNLFVKIKNFIPILDNIYNVYTTEETIIKGNNNPVSPLTGKVEFKDVAFSYNNRDFVIHNLSGVYEPGDIVGIIGENGSGKTTICRLMTKLCTVNQGKILLDDIDINDIDIDYLQTQIGVMTQDSFILTDEFNAILNSEQAIREMQNYLNEMNFSSTGITITDEGFRVKENKLNISGGEAQKLALYKLYLDNKPISILDEPTASLDSVSEEKMINFINNNFKGKTLFIITHKPEILNLCTKIVNLDLQQKEE